MMYTKISANPKAVFNKALDDTGMSLRQLSEKTEVDFNKVFAISTNSPKSNISTGDIRLLAEALDLHPEMIDAGFNDGGATEPVVFRHVFFQNTIDPVLFERSVRMLVAMSKSHMDIELFYKISLDSIKISLKAQVESGFITEGRAKEILGIDAWDVL